MWGDLQAGGQCWCGCARLHSAGGSVIKVISDEVVVEERIGPVGHLNFIVLTDGQLAQARQITDTRRRQNGDGDVCLATTARIDGIDGIDVWRVVGIVYIGRRADDDAGGEVWREDDF